ncbi:hypothetical protein HNY73_013223 [Argiope bruennichi]|uniref:Uncharacterized protein n=1 Tax=Argiope bruennichi TaxID=94029 RepID=A0A8T0F395_ARGBR|nr:hypothetical protein HNY73_013223 [Argiope bruennichi]
MMSEEEEGGGKKEVVGGTTHSPLTLQNHTRLFQPSAFPPSLNNTSSPVPPAAHTKALPPHPAMAGPRCSQIAPPTTACNNEFLASPFSVLCLFFPFATFGFTTTTTLGRYVEDAFWNETRSFSTTSLPGIDASISEKYADAAQFESVFATEYSDAAVPNIRSSSSSYTSTHSVD